MGAPCRTRARRWCRARVQLRAVPADTIAKGAWRSSRTSSTHSASTCCMGAAPPFRIFAEHAPNLDGIPDTFGRAQREQQPHQSGSGGAGAQPHGFPPPPSSSHPQPPSRQPPIKRFKTHKWMQGRIDARRHRTAPAASWRPRRGSRGTSLSTTAQSTSADKVVSLSLSLSRSLSVCVPAYRPSARTHAPAYLRVRACVPACVPALSACGS